MDGRQDRADARSTASDRRQDRSEDRAGASDARMDLSDARQDATAEHQVLQDRRMNKADRRSDVSELLAKKRHQADLTQRIIVVLTIIVIIVIITLQSLVLIHVVRLEEENKQLNLQLLTLACAAPSGPETAAEIRVCVERQAKARP